jgi:hypothetical protein
MKNDEMWEAVAEAANNAQEVTEFVSEDAIKRHLLELPSEIRHALARHLVAPERLAVVPIDDLRRANTLIQTLTVRQVIEAGDAAIDAAGLNPWCMNEGAADGSESIGWWRFEDVLAAAEDQS